MESHPVPAAVPVAAPTAAPAAAPPSAAAADGAGPRGGTGGTREVAWLAAPIVLTQLSQTIMHVVDSIFVGRLGPAELGALGFGGVWLWTVMSIFSGMAMGVQTFVSQHHGAGDEKACGGWLWQGVYAVVPAAALGLFAFAACAAPLWSTLGTTPEIQHHAVAYVHTRPIGLTGMVLWTALAAFFRGFGETRIPLVATVVSNLTNLVLDYGLIFGRLGLPAWGIAGAGTATSIAEWVGVGVLAVALGRRRVAERFATRPVAPDAQAIRRFLRTGAPIGGQWFLDMAAFAIFTQLVAHMGTVAMAATQATISLLSVSFMQAIGIGLATTTLVGRYKGAGDLPAAVRSYHSARKLALTLAGAVAALFLLAPETLARLYTSDAEVLALARPLFALAAAFQLFDALQIVSGGALRGAGDTRWPFLAQTLLAWLLRLPLVWLFAFALEGGVVGAWYAEFTFVLALALALAWRLRSGAWQKVRI
jgi:MATE family multidrug resistance protein